MIPDLMSILADFRPFHSELQIDRFIIGGNGGTPWGMYQQAVRELHTRWQALKEDYETRIGLQEDIGDLEAAGATTRQAAGDLRRARARLESVQRMIVDREREFRRFLAHCRAWRAQLGDLTPERRQELEEEFWAHTALVRAASEVMSCGRPQPGTFQLILALPAHVRASVLTRCQDPSMLAEWFHTFEPPTVDLGPYLESGSIMESIAGPPAELALESVEVSG